MADQDFPPAVSNPSASPIICLRDRVAGRTNAPFTLQETRRELGGYAIYLARQAGFELQCGGVWQAISGLAVVPPYQPHALRHWQGVGSLLLEPETVDPAFMRDARWCYGTAAGTAWRDRIAAGFDDPSALTAGPDPGLQFDLRFFGEPLPFRRLDPRIGWIARRISEQPDGDADFVGEITAAVDLSASRLSHLFHAQLGVSLRRFRAWKRVRNAMSIAAANTKLLDIAMAAGYADATHLSHAIARYFGRQPKQVCGHWHRNVSLSERR